jgi:hypothetical protein
MELNFGAANHQLQIPGVVDPLDVYFDPITPTPVRASLGSEFDSPLIVTRSVTIRCSSTPDRH